MAPQEMIDRLKAAGDQVLGLMRATGEAYLPAGADKLWRDQNIGRDLALAVFLAAVGDDSVNRIALIEGFANAIGESYAQQPDDAAQAIQAALMRGFFDGVQMGREWFRPAGRA